MYSRKASLFHLPCSIILSVRMSCKYRNIAKLDRIEWHPTSLGWKPRFSDPITDTVALMCSKISCNDIKVILCIILNIFTGKSRDPPGYCKILNVKQAHIRTRYSFVPFLCIVIVWSLTPFFLLTNVILIDNASSNCMFRRILATF